MRSQVPVVRPIASTIRYGLRVTIKCYIIKLLISSDLTMSQPITIPQASEELIDFIASGSTPQQIVSFQASEQVKERVTDLAVRPCGFSIRQGMRTKRSNERKRQAYQQKKNPNSISFCNWNI